MLALFYATVCLLMCEQCVKNAKKYRSISDANFYHQFCRFNNCFTQCQMLMNVPSHVPCVTNEQHAETRLDPFLVYVNMDFTEMAKQIV